MVSRWKSILKMPMILVLVCSLPVSAWSTSACQWQKDPQNPRAAILQLKTGPRITLLGHHHGDRQWPFMMSSLVKADPTTLDNQAFVTALDKMSSQGSLAMQQAKQDIEYLRKKLSSDEALQFVGFESSDETAQKNETGYAGLWEAYQTVLKTRDLQLNSRQEHVMSTALGPIFYLKFTEPEIFANKRIRGFESSLASEHYVKVAGDVATLLQELRKKAVGHSKFLGDISMTDFQLWSLYDRFQPDTDSLKIIESVKTAPMPEEFRELTLQWVQARLVEMTALKNREKAVAHALIENQQSGILLMGQKHLRSLSDILRQACESQP